MARAAAERSFRIWKTGNREPELPFLSSCFQIHPSETDQPERISGKCSNPEEELQQRGPHSESEELQRGRSRIISAIVARTIPMSIGLMRCR